MLSAIAPVRICHFTNPVFSTKTLKTKMTYGLAEYDCLGKRTSGQDFFFFAKLQLVKVPLVRFVI